MKSSYLLGALREEVTLALAPQTRSSSLVTLLTLPPPRSSLRNEVSTVSAVSWVVQVSDEAKRTATAKEQACETPELIAGCAAHERDPKQALNQGDIDAYKHAALRRPPSWWSAEMHRPTQGATCSCC